MIQRLRLWGPRHRASDIRWSIAANTQIEMADRTALDELGWGYDLAGSVDGVLCASRHPTGWFVHGLRSDSMSRTQAREFAEFTTVRVYLLLREGPRPPAWRLSPDGREWRAFLLAAPAEPLSEVPDVLPPHWSPSG